MKKDAQKFIDCLDDAVHLLDDYPSIHFSGPNLNLEYTSPEQFDLALFEQWSELCAPVAQKKLPIRLIQHLSCTGGTLISKCLAAMPNVALLSEVHPLSRLLIDSAPKFAPTDLTYLAIHGRFPLVDELSENMFKADIDVISVHLKLLGKHLVIREHSHSDFLVGDSPNENSTIRMLLEDDYPILAILTVRHPVDCYLSLLENGWIHFSPPTFDEYCRRYLLFISRNEDLPMCKYEDFVNDPKKEIKLLCDALDLAFNEDFLDVFDLNIMSGDSGRSSNTIGKRKRREYDEKFFEEAKESAMYLQLCEQLNYDPSLATPGDVNH